MDKGDRPVQEGLHIRANQRARHWYRDPLRASSSPCLTFCRPSPPPTRVCNHLQARRVPSELPATYDTPHADGGSCGAAEAALGSGAEGGAEAALRAALSTREPEIEQAGCTVMRTAPAPTPTWTAATDDDDVEDEKPMAKSRRSSGPSRDEGGSVGPPDGIGRGDGCDGGRRRRARGASGRVSGESVLADEAEGARGSLRSASARSTSQARDGESGLAPTPPRRATAARRPGAYDSGGAG